jgi:allantoicase
MTARMPFLDLIDLASERLGARGVVHGVDVETTHFTGNFPASCAIDAGDGAAWQEIVERTALSGDRHNLIAVEGALPATHIRLRIYPDGGVARLRVYGEVVPDWVRLQRQGDVDLAAAAHGGLVIACSDMFYGSRQNLIMPGPATHMGDGWETKRRRGPGHDWTIIRLGSRGAIRRVEVDTRHFKGNAPGAEFVARGDAEDGPDSALASHVRRRSAFDR